MSIESLYWFFVWGVEFAVAASWLAYLLRWHHEHHSGHLLAATFAGIVFELGWIFAAPLLFSRSPIEYGPLAAFLSAVGGGFLISLVWLWFWLKEDEAPEPRGLLIIAFVGGMLAIPGAVALELLWRSVAQYFISPSLFEITISDSAYILNSLEFALIMGYAFAEELVKYFFVSTLIFWRVEYDEPADAMIYLITGALGFAAVENAIYLTSPFLEETFQGLALTNLRFLGATPLHALASGFLGYFIAKSFFKDRLRREFALAAGLVFATLLHAAFNLSILISRETRFEDSLVILAVAGVFILFSFERVKHTIKKYYA